MKKHNLSKTTNKNVMEVLKRLLSQIEPINFHEKIGGNPDSKILLKYYMVLVIDTLIDTAASNDWGLCTHNDYIYVYNGAYWQPVEENDFKRFLVDVAIAMGVPELDAKHYKFPDELYAQFILLATLPTLQPRNKILIPLQNGTYEIDGNEHRLRENRREDFLTYQLPFEYDPKAKCPMFRMYLWEVLPDVKCRKLLAEYMGFIFTTNLKLEKVLFLYGTGSNGKSVFFDIVKAVIGSENISSYSLQSLTRDNSYERAEISTKLLNYSTEINEKMDVEVFKKLASGEPVGARQIYGRPFTMENYHCKFMFNCNVLPVEIERTHAFFRRLLIIPFNRVFYEGEQDINLAKKIIASELSGVFNWILDGLNRLLSQGRFTESEVVWKQIDEYRKESDSVALFLDDRGVGFGVDKDLPLSVMYYDYVGFCKEYGFKPLSVINMSKRLKATGLMMVKANYGMRVWFGKSIERINAEEAQKEKRERHQARLREEDEERLRKNDASDESDD